MKDKNNFHKQILIPIYNFNLVIIYGINQEQLVDITNLEIEGKIEGGVFLLKDDEDCEAIGVFFNTDTDSSVIAHECLHISNLIFNMIGYKPDNNNYGDDETHAYLLQYLVKTIEDCLLGIGYNPVYKDLESG